MDNTVKVVEIDQVREKLIELLSHVQYLGGLEEKIADHLIANGVTVTDTNVGKWIPVTERLPENDVKVLAIVKEDGYNRIAFSFNEDGRWWDCFYDGFRNINVTHWMPLPEAPSE